MTNSIGLTIEPVGKKLLGAEIGQTQNARRVPGGTRVRGYHKFAKGAIFGYEKEWTDPEGSSEEYLTKSLFSLKALLGIEIVWKEKIF